MHRRRPAWRAAALLGSMLLLLLAACARFATSPTQQSDVAASPDLSEDPQPSASESLTEVFPYDRFSDPTLIDNPYLPLARGTRWAFDGHTVEDDEEIPHQIVTIITDLTKEIDGVEAVVGYEEDWSDGQLVEVEIFFVTQDDEGNVWRMGEYPEEFEDGQFVAAKPWLAGVQDALAGYMMRAEPRAGDRSYAQGWGPAVEWADRGRVIEDGIQDCVAFGCYEEVVVVEEWDIAEPLARQLKFHAPGIGLIRVDWSGTADQGQEELELVEFGQLTAEELADARAKALALEARAYDIAPDVYGASEPMQTAP
jgi:hypothetical protein